MTDWEISSLLISCKKIFLCQFFLGISLFFASFKRKGKKKACFEIYFHELITYVKEHFKGTLSVNKNVTCLKVIFFKGTTFLVLSLYFLSSINCYSIKTMETIV